MNLTITDKQGLAIRLNEQGPMITPEELTRVEKAVASRLESASWLMFCGSIPPGVSSDFYTKLIHMARERKVKTMLDTDGDALLRGIEAVPDGGEPESARSGAVVESRADHAGAIFGSCHAHQSHGRRSGVAVAGGARRSGGE